MAWSYLNRLSTSLVNKASNVIGKEEGIQNFEEAFRKEILEALDYENLVDLDEAMQEATSLGLEGKLYQGKKAIGGW